MLSFLDSDPLKVKARELEVLAEAVRTENYRKHALDAQSRFLRSLSFVILSSYGIKLFYRGRPAFSDVGDQSPNYLELNKEGLDWDRIAEKVRRSPILC